MASEQSEDFERRLLAKVRSSLDYLDDTYDEYEIEHFVLTFRYYVPDTDPLEPWEGGRYVGMFPKGFTTGSSPSYEIDEWLLREALNHTLNRRSEADADVEEHEEEDEDDEVEDV